MTIRYYTESEIKQKILSCNKWFEYYEKKSKNMPEIMPNFTQSEIEQKIVTDNIWFEKYFKKGYKMTPEIIQSLIQNDPNNISLLFKYKIPINEEVATRAYLDRKISVVNKNRLHRLLADRNYRKQQEKLLLAREKIKDKQLKIDFDNQIERGE